MDAIAAYIADQLVRHGAAAAVLGLAAWDLRKQFLECQRSSKQMIERIWSYLEDSAKHTMPD